MNFLKNHKYNLLFLTIVTFLAYINIYQNDFLSDDLEGIVFNKNIGDAVKSSGSLAYLINTFTFLLFGLNKPAFHFMSVLFHTANVIVIYVLLTQINIRKNLILPVTLVFALHPIHTEVVTWISGRVYAVFSFFTLLSLLFFILYVNRSRLQYLIISLVSYLLAIYTSEKGIVLALFVFLYIITYKNIKKYIFPLSTYILITFLFGLTLISKLVGRISDTNPSYLGNAPIYNPLLQIPTAVSSYIELFIIPYGLTLYHSSIITPIQFAVKAVITIVFFLSAIFFFKKSKLQFFASGIFILSLAPYLLPISVAWIYAERYIYLGSVGLSIILVAIIYKITGIIKIKSYFPVIIITLSAVYFLLTIQRNSQWKSQDTLWPATVKFSANIPFAHNNMGDYYIRHGNPEMAIKEFTTAINLQSGLYPEAIHNLGNVYLSLNEATAAAKLYEEAIKLKPTQPESFIQLARIHYEIFKNPQEAKKILLEGIKYSPQNLAIQESLKNLTSIYK